MTGRNKWPPPSKSSCRCDWHRERAELTAERDSARRECDRLREAVSRIAYGLARYPRNDATGQEVARGVAEELHAALSHPAPPETYTEGKQ